MFHPDVRWRRDALIKGYGSCNRSTLSETESKEVADTDSEAERVVRPEKELNLLRCKTGSSMCDRSLLTPSEKEEVANLDRERDLPACQCGDGRCDKSLLTPEDAGESCQRPTPRVWNFLACRTGGGYCDEKLLNPSGVKEVENAKRQLNAWACETGWGVCDPSNPEKTK